MHFLKFATNKFSKKLSKLVAAMAALALIVAVIPATEAQATTPERKAYFAKYVGYSISLGNEWGIPYDLILADGAIESGNGTSVYARRYHNHHGMGTSIHFSSDWAGYNDFCRLMHTDRYQAALSYPDDAKSFLRVMTYAGYNPYHESYIHDVSYVIDEVRAWAAANGYPTAAEAHAQHRAEQEEAERLQHEEEQHEAEMKARLEAERQAAELAAKQAAEAELQAERQAAEARAQAQVIAAAKRQELLDYAQQINAGNAALVPGTAGVNNLIASVMQYDPEMSVEENTMTLTMAGRKGDKARPQLASNRAGVSRQLDQILVSCEKWEP